MSKRNIFQAFFLVVALAILTFVITVGKASIHNICPYAIVCFGILKGNILILSLGLASLGIFLGILLMVMSMFWGRVFCAYVCPIGTFQELLFMFSHRRKRRQIPYYAEHKLCKIKYWILGINFVLVVSGFAWIYINFCPIYALSRLPALAPLGIITIMIIVIGGVFMERFWCGFLCPYAALLNIAQVLGALFGIRRRKIRRNLERCTDCGICSLYCPMNINVNRDEYVESVECIMCGRCAKKCPKTGTITIEREP
ncbi:MAG: 4Fe-4S binding protein [Candidatus Cloacimonetes bacterium]|nr:4Fe-4S binding protein [Candidatus Cloacimonadota bacterium]